MILYRAIIATFSSEISSLSPSWKAKFTNLLWSGFTRQADLPNISHDECVVSSRTRGSAIRLSLETESQTYRVSPFTRRVTIPVLNMLPKCTRALPLPFSDSDSLCTASSPGLPLGWCKAHSGSCIYLWQRPRRGDQKSTRMRARHLTAKGVLVGAWERSCRLTGSHNTPCLETPFHSPQYGRRHHRAPISSGPSREKRSNHSPPFPFCSRSCSGLKENWPRWCHTSWIEARTLELG